MCTLILPQLLIDIAVAINRILLCTSFHFLYWCYTEGCVSLLLMCLMMKTVVLLMIILFVTIVTAKDDHLFTPSGGMVKNN